MNIFKYYNEKKPKCGFITYLLVYFYTLIQWNNDPEYNEYFYKCFDRLFDSNLDNYFADYDLFVLKREEDDKSYLSPTHIWQWFEMFASFYKYDGKVKKLHRCMIYILLFLFNNRIVKCLYLLHDKYLCKHGYKPFLKGYTYRGEPVNCYDPTEIRIDWKLNFH